MYANLAGSPTDEELAMGTWYRSRDTIGGDYPFGQNIINKKWPLLKGIKLSDLISHYPFSVAKVC